jgi:predicted small lipoprotein YifL
MKRPQAGRIATLLGATLLLAGCGQKGPLFLPGAGKQSVPPASAPAPASDDKEPEKKQADKAPVR